MHDDIPQAHFNILEFNPANASEEDKRALLGLSKSLRGERAETDYDAFVRNNLKGATLFVGRAGKDIKAAIILDTARPQYWIRHNIVSADAAGLGLGRGMLERAIQEARTRGAKKILLTCNDIPERERAKKAYEAAGFRVVNPVHETFKDASGTPVSVQLLELNLEA